MAADSASLAEGLVWQAKLAEGRGPTYEAIIADLATRIAANNDDPIVAALRSDPHDPIRSALILRYLAAVQRVALRLGDSPLHRCYPTLGGVTDPAQAVATFHPFALAHLDQVLAGLRATVQTNETGRAAVLSAGVARAAELTGVSSVRLLDVGSSAGLNLSLDQYRVDNGPAGGWGPVDSPLVLAGFWDRPPPTTVAFTVVERAGCDLNPLNLADPNTAAHLRSFVWPDDVVRAARLEAALAAAVPVNIDSEEAVTWTRRQLQEPQPGVLTVVMHSVALVYFSDADAAAFMTTIAEAGSRATTNAPIAHVSFEVSQEAPTMADLNVTTWPGGRPELCSRSTPHGLHAQWMADDAHR